MYSKHHTKAIVLGAYNVGEASRTYRLFTADMGVVFARCQSSREGRSRHRYGLQFSSVSDVSLVRSRDGWRITNVTPVSSIFFEHEDRQKECLPFGYSTLFVDLSSMKNKEVFCLIWCGMDSLHSLVLRSHKTI
ncbi:recombination protein O N-terminal domain-containing protein [Candidatus Campbellbacteria bacterium]|nr:MAG: recombination protein O N-terminal domain-containing protein [Candidatus Campbellbacteria bacterium]